MCPRRLHGQAVSSTDPSPSSSRVAYQNDTSFQMSMTRTTKARLTMQLMAEAEQWNYHKCLAIAAQLKAEGHKPDLPIYTALMTAASNVAEWQDAWAIFDDMLTSGVEPDIGIMNALMKVRYTIHKNPQALMASQGTTTATVFIYLEGSSDHRRTKDYSQRYYHFDHGSAMPFSRQSRNGFTISFHRQKIQHYTRFRHCSIHNNICRIIRSP
jgi:pentatricopeptide repeat protein